MGIDKGTDRPVHYVGTLDLDTRQCLRVMLNVGAHVLQLVCAYLDDLSEKVRFQHARALINALEPDMPTIIVGDFNTLRSEFDGASMVTRAEDLAVRALAHTLELMRAKGKIVSNVREMKRREVLPILKVQGFHDVDRSKKPTAPASLPLIGIDYVLHNSRVSAEAEIVEVGNASNHRAILFSTSLEH